MERVAIRFLVATAVILAAAAVISGELVDETSATAGLLWSTGKDEPDPLSKAKPENSDDSSAAAVVNDHDDLDGGFSSLEGMLHWAIGMKTFLLFFESFFFCFFSDNVAFFVIN